MGFAIVLSSLCMMAENDKLTATVAALFTGKCRFEIGPATLAKNWNIRLE